MTFSTTDSPPVGGNRSPGARRPMYAGRSGLRAAGMATLRRFALALTLVVAMLGLAAVPAQAASSSCTIAWRSCTSSAVEPGSRHGLEVYVENWSACRVTYRIRDVRNGVVFATGTVRGFGGTTRRLITGLYSEYTIRLDANCGPSTGLIRSY